jgi:ribose transport system ATP-binding protein
MTSNSGQSTDVPVLELRNLSKTFSGVTVLHEVDLTVMPGEVHGLLGENGSGKSTLIKVLAGVNEPDEGSAMTFNGEAIGLPLQPGRFRELGISFVHQDLGLLDELTVLENMRIGATAQASAFAPIRWKREAVALTELLRGYGVSVDPFAAVSTLEPTERALLAIVRAVEEVRRTADRRGHGLLILDEPTVFLPESGVKRLFSLINDVVREHASVIFVSHDIDEVYEHTDRATVLRNGHLAGTIVTAESSPGEIVSLIIGRQLGHQTQNEQHHRADDSVLRVTGLSARRVREFDLDLRRGEVVGLTGLMGSGYETPLYTLFGHYPAEAGELMFGGTTRPLAGRTPSEAIEQGMALIPANRKTDGSVGSLSVGENLMLLNLDRYASAGSLRRPALRSAAAELIHEFDVRPPDADANYENLSGGNQQKVVMAKWLQMNPAVILLDEPTQGVDIGAREQILQGLLDRARATGAAILCASSDYDQLARISDRVLVFEHGRVVVELSSGELTKDAIARAVLDRSARSRPQDEMSL